MPAKKLSACLSAPAIVAGHFFERLELIVGRRNIFGSTISAIREDGGFVEFAEIAMAGGFAAFSAKSVERTWEDGIAFEARLEEIGEKLLNLEKLGAKAAEFLIHRDLGKGEGSTVGI